MHITFSDGRTMEARIYQATETTLRVAIPGEEDLSDFTCIRGQWLSEHCEMVNVDYQWERLETAALPSMEDCICSPALASQLIEELYAGSEGERVLAAAS